MTDTTSDAEKIVVAIMNLTATVEALTEEVGCLRSTFEETTGILSRSDSTRRAVRILNVGD
jgi:hypothetical protein